MNGWDSSRRTGRRGFTVKLTREVLKRTPTCQLNYPGCLGDATEVDHRISWAEGMAMGWAPEEIDHPDNAQSACSRCHATKTQLEASRGRARQRRQPRRPPRRHPGLLPTNPPTTPPQPPPS